jgi:hypothetical protein
MVMLWALAIVFLVYYGLESWCNRNEQTLVMAGVASADLWRLFLLFSLLASLMTLWRFLTVYELMVRSLSNILDNIRTLRTNQTQTEAILTQINENLLLSDAVKSIAFREKDRSVLEDAIHQDIRMEKWESADLLINDLETRFGCVMEAQALRAELARFRKASIQEKIDNAIRHIESLWLIHHYGEAQKEVDILVRLYPDNLKVKNLNGQTDKHREEHKKVLLSRWEDSVKNNLIDEGIEILQLLDNYLSPTEAAALEESARGVFRAKLSGLGVQFKMLVTEKKWDQALRIGKEIVDEFPNSRMAQEVRDKLAVLEQRAKTMQANL